MLYLIQDDKEYTIIDFEKELFHTNWERSLQELLHIKDETNFLTPEEEAHSEIAEEAEDDVYMKDYTTVQDYCQALCNTPDLVSPKIILCLGDSLYKLEQRFPELFI